ncbi:MAG TPA: hypothetical protein VGC64_01670 [Pyrinomonadaceae bacterium]|jgi:hypothetical protein
MKRCLKAIALALLLGVMTYAVALGAGLKIKEKIVRLPQDVMINGTLLKQGTYKMRFDEETGELSFIKDKATVAKTTARLEQRQRRASALEFGLDPLKDGKALRSITFAGDKQKFVLVDANQ